MVMSPVRFRVQHTRRRPTRITLGGQVLERDRRLLQPIRTKTATELSISRAMDLNCIGVHPKFFLSFMLVLPTYSKSGSCQSDTLGEMEIFKMAAKMAAVKKNGYNCIRPTSSLTNVLFWSNCKYCRQGTDMICTIYIQCLYIQYICKNVRRNMNHNNNHNRTYI